MSKTIDLCLIRHPDRTRQMMAMGDGWHTNFYPAATAFEMMRKEIEDHIGVFETDKEYQYTMFCIHVTNLRNKHNLAGQAYPIVLAE